MAARAVERKTVKDLIDIDAMLAARAKDLEGLSWYEISSALGMHSFNSQGTKPIDFIAESARISDSSAVLIVGCGAGGTAVHLAESTRAEVHGIDISAESIKAAIGIASRSPAREKLHFQTGDAHALPFPPGAFDVLITEYMAFFLRPEDFKGFFSALRPGGRIALAEIVKDPGVTAGADAEILRAEALYSEVLEYKFHIPLITEYAEWLTRAGFQNVQVDKRFSNPTFREKLENAGGWKKLLKMSRAMVKLMRESPVLRRKFISIGRVKRVLFEKQVTAKYVFQAVVSGRKP
jgi:SAM-dependent methyltransferase